MNAWTPNTTMTHTPSENTFRHLDVSDQLTLKHLELIGGAV